MKKKGLQSDKLLGNYMVSLLADFGIMDEAQKVFDGLSHRSEWSWNSLMRGYINSGNPELALAQYQSPLHLFMKNLLRTLHILSTNYPLFPCSSTLKTPLFVFDITQDFNPCFQGGKAW